MSNMEDVRRERETEAKVRALDADDIVEWIHALEDASAEACELLYEAKDILKAMMDDSKCCGDPDAECPLQDQQDLVEFVASSEKVIELIEDSLP